jgi:hypothetical protein
MQIVRQQGANFFNARPTNGLDFHYDNNSSNRRFKSKSWKFDKKIKRRLMLAN